MNEVTLTIHGTEYKVILQPDRYRNGNLCIKAIDVEDGCPVCTCTVNPGVEVPYPSVCIKDYSENQGVEQSLIAEGIIDPKVVNRINSGFVILNCHNLTDKGKKLLGEL